MIWLQTLVAVAQGAAMFRVWTYRLNGERK